MIKRKTPRYSRLALLAALALAFAGSQANAQVFSVKIVGSPADPVTGTAGAVPESGWNNIDSTTYTTGTITSSTAATATLTITNTAGTFNSAVANDGGGNGSLLDGYSDGGVNTGPGGTLGSTTAAVSGLTGLYNVYIYEQGDALRPGNTGDGLPNYSINGTTYYTAEAAGQAVEPLVRGGTQTGANSFLIPPPVATGNYIEIDGVAAVGGTITIANEADNTSFRSPFNGFQLVSVPEPSTVGLSLIGLALLVFVGYKSRFKEVA